MNPTPRLILIVMALMLFSTPAAAHIVHGEGLMAGLAHPFHGMDHILAALAVGLWAGQRQDRLAWALPGLFAVALLISALAGHASGNPLPLMEPGIAATVLLLGIFIAFALNMPAAVSAALLVVFAVFHGWAHGVEQPVGTTVGSYLIGLAVGTLVLQFAGILASRKLLRADMLKLAGGFVAGAGSMMLLAVM